ncbi:unnamed protein product [Cyclocybe aegerita]|uniref:Uncharacterized protein n=1 Tax=Cyclocybe aegerita TaxID=1973307 RepID=A0A8S0WRI2_CYCAE|nr:unnamed protein product [Cyclocybe aegerita]
MSLIPHFLYDILRRLMPPNPDEDPELPSALADETLHDIYPWKRAVTIHYYDRKTMLESQVTRIDWYKSEHAFKHEYLNVTLLRPERPVSYLRIERRPSSVRDIRENAVSEEDISAFTKAERKKFRKDMKLEEADLKMLAHTGKMSSLTGLQLSIDASKTVSGGQRAASDTVAHVSRPSGVRAEEKHKSPKLVASYHSFNPPFPLRDLALIADIVHRRDIKYQLLLKNCYWYADTLMGLVRNLYMPTIESGGGYLDAGQYLGKRVIFQSHQDTHDVLSLVPVVTEARSAHDRYLVEKEEQNNRADREATRADEAERRVGEVEQRADKAERRANEAEQRANEAEQRVEELARQLQGARAVSSNVG